MGHSTFESSITSLIKAVTECPGFEVEIHQIGLAGNAPKVASPSYAYAHRGGLLDIVGGSNGDDCGGDYLCTAVKGYDAPTGPGSPRTWARCNGHAA